MDPVETTEERRGDAPPVPVRWTGDGAGLSILDQTELPERRVERELRSLEEVEEAIQSLRVRGAPLIGITAAMGVAALAAGAARGDGSGGSGSPPEPSLSGDGPTAAGLAERVSEWCDRLARARPTAVNLARATDRMRAAARLALRSASREHGLSDAEDARAVTGGGAAWLADVLRREAESIREEDEAMCRRIGEHALSLLRDGGTALTHCNTGALATGGIGTALAPIYLAHDRGWRVHVFADETRPLLQGSRLTAWELRQAGVDVTVISDGTAATLMAERKPDVVLVGADRIAANGDVANKVGTYGLAVLAEHHGVPFYVLAPTTTVDPDTPSGEEIPIEFRSGEEIRRGFGRLTAPRDADTWSPAFDVTPADLITGIVTERGISRPPYRESLREAVRGAADPGGSGP